ncbi:MAG: OmpH family outer membrane protein [Alistipes sp.]|nr:OmpH family outer membrane protein [Alistipes sp.]
MKKIIKLTLVLAMMLGATTVSAQKLARINTQEVFALMPETAEMQKNLEAFGKDLQEQIEQIQVEFNNKYAEFQKNQATMAESIKQMKQQELEQLQQRYSEFQQIAQQDFQKKQQELATPIQEKLSAAIGKVAKAGGYAVVFDTSIPTMAYIDEAQATDLAPAVKKELGISESATPVQ